ncbi:MAG: hypothetical protein E7304_03590 [Butyrivibrio sp.]|nr:hypothetical protein [Butyrivibrio sp.]
MTQEELVDIWTTPGYKMTEDELEKAKIIASDELDKFEYRSGHVPNLETQEEHERYARYLSFMNKCSKVASASTGFMAPFVSISDFGCDAAEDIFGTAAEIGATSFDEIAGTDTLSSVLKFRQDYSKYSDEFMASAKREQMNAETQNPKYYIGGKVVGNMLLYTVTSPIFKGMASALGVKNGLGLFFTNQLAQNVQDLVLDTRNVYNDLIADGELSDADKMVLKWNVGINGAMNMAFGMGDLYQLYKGGKTAKGTERIVEANSTVGEKQGITNATAMQIDPESVTQTIRKLDSETVYKMVSESDQSWITKNYDLITPKNASECIVCSEIKNGEVVYNLDWPKYGGYEIDSIKGIAELSGEVDVSRVGSDYGCAMAIGKNENGLQFNNSQRAIPTSNSLVETGRMDIDEYKTVIDVLSSKKNKKEIVAALLDKGYDYSQIGDMIDDYDFWWAREEISGRDSIMDGIRLKEDQQIDPKYGFYGIAAEWDMGNVHMSGSAGQMNTIFSWGTLKETGLVSNLSVITVE